MYDYAYSESEDIKSVVESIVPTYKEKEEDKIRDRDICKKQFKRIGDREVIRKNLPGISDLQSDGGILWKK